MDALGITYQQLLTQLVSFLVLFFLLYKLAYKPIIGMLDSRAEKIKNSLDAAENAKKDAESTAEKIENCFVNFEHPTFNTVYEWIEMWRDGCSPHNTPVYTGLKKYHKKMDTWNDYRFKMAFWHLSYYDAIHREGMWQDIDMLWDIQQQDDHTLWIGPKRMIKQNGIWRPDNGNFNTIYNPTSPIDCTTPYSSRWF